MGAWVSRQRPEDQPPLPVPAASGPQVYAQYPAQPPYQPQQVPLPSPPGYYPPNNAQYYGGYHPSYRPQPYPVPPPPPGAQRPYPHAPPRPGGSTVGAPSPAPTQELTKTMTIRNCVNLHKRSLRVTPLPEDPTKLAITFAFDATLPGLATTFVAVTEAPNRSSRLTTAKQPPAPAVPFDKGLKQRFAGGAHVVDLSLYDPDPLRSGELSAAAGDTYPLAIRLEVVTERGDAAGHTLAELAPGGEQQPWMLSQTTFAALRREEDGSWGVRVLKQKLWVEGVPYDLQEIYGMEHAAGFGGRSSAAASGASGIGAAHADAAAGLGAAPTAEESEERLCVICLVAPRDTTVLPCRHMCMCYDCAQELRKQSSKCPICRNHVESLLHIKYAALSKARADRQRDMAATGGDSSSQGGAAEPQAGP